MPSRENAKPQAVCRLAIRGSRLANRCLHPRQGKDGIGLPRQRQERPRCDKPQDAVQVPVLQEARHVGGIVVVDGPVEQRAVAAEAAARHADGDPPVHGAEKERLLATQGMPETPDPPRIHLAPGGEVVQRPHEVPKHLGLQAGPLGQPLVGRESLVILALQDGMPPLLETDGVRRERHVPACGQLQRVELLRVAGETRRLALSQMELPMVLMDTEDGGMGPWRRWQKQVRLHPLPSLDGVAHLLPDAAGNGHALRHRRAERSGIGHSPHASPEDPAEPLAHGRPLTRPAPTARPAPDR